MSVAIHSFADRAAQAKALARAVADGLRGAIRARGRASLSVPGGSTPGAFLAALSEEELDWARVAVMLNDERWVDEAHERSNARLLKATLLRGAASAARFIGFYTGDAAPDGALEAIHARVSPALPLDVLVLGMGTDGHTASLFPGGDRLGEALDLDQPWAVLPLRAPGAPEPRLTLTLPVLRGARRTYLLINGAEKRRVLAEALDPAGAVEAMPVRAVLRGGGLVDVFDAP